MERTELVLLCHSTDLTVVNAGTVFVEVSQGMCHDSCKYDFNLRDQTKLTKGTFCSLPPKFGAEKCETDFEPKAFFSSQCPDCLTMAAPQIRHLPMPHRNKPLAGPRNILVVGVRSILVYSASQRAMWSTANGDGYCSFGLRFSRINCRLSDLKKKPNPLTYEKQPTPRFPEPPCRWRSAWFASLGLLLLLFTSPCPLSAN